MLRAVGVKEGNTIIDARHASGSCPWGGLCLCAGLIHSDMRVALQAALKRGVCSGLVLWGEQAT